MSELNFNGLTPGETERLAMLAEECAEVVQIVGKILRHGYDSYHPENQALTNKDLLANEIADVDAVIKEMKRSELKDYECRDIIGSRWKKKLLFSHHQEKDDE